MLEGLLLGRRLAFVEVFWERHLQVQGHRGDQEGLREAEEPVHLSVGLSKFGHNVVAERLALGVERGRRVLARVAQLEVEVLVEAEFDGGDLLQVLLLGQFVRDYLILQVDDEVVGEILLVPQHLVEDLPARVYVDCDNGVLVFRRHLRVFRVRHEDAATGRTLVWVVLDDLGLVASFDPLHRVHVPGAAPRVVRALLCEKQIVRVDAVAPVRRLVNRN